MVLKKKKRKTDRNYPSQSVFNDGNWVGGGGGGIMYLERVVCPAALPCSTPATSTPASESGEKGRTAPNPRPELVACLTPHHFRATHPNASCTLGKPLTAPRHQRRPPATSGSRGQHHRGACGEARDSTGSSRGGDRA